MKNLPESVMACWREQFSQSRDQIMALPGVNAAFSGYSTDKNEGGFSVYVDRVDQLEEVATKAAALCGLPLGVVVARTDVPVRASYPKNADQMVFTPALDPRAVVELPTGRLEIRASNIADTISDLLIGLVVSIRTGQIPWTTNREGNTMIRRAQLGDVDVEITSRPFERPTSYPPDWIKVRQDGRNVAVANSSSLGLMCVPAKELIQVLISMDNLNVNHPVKTTPVVGGKSLWSL